MSNRTVAHQDGISIVSAVLEKALEDVEKAGALLETRLASKYAQDTGYRGPSPEEVSLANLRQVLRRMQRRFAKMVEYSPDDD